MTTLQNLKNNSLGYYPCLVGGKLHTNRDENLNMLVRNNTHETLCQWNKHTGVVRVLGKLAWHEKKDVNRIIEVWRPWHKVDWDATSSSGTKTLKSVTS